VSNPWQISPKQGEALAGLVEYPSSKALARKLGIEAKTIEARVARAREQMGGRSRVQAVVEWDRWERAHRV
jgi:DNA-binding CsgD family transcriptional regulator